MKNPISIYSGSNNSSLGYKALNNVTTGSNNTAIGYQSLTSVTNGALNTAIGYNTDVSDSLTNAIAIGANAKVSKSYTIQLGDSTITNVNTFGDISTPGIITASAFYGNVYGVVQSAVTATKLQNALTINGTIFDGSIPKSITISSSGTSIGTDPSFNTVTANTKFIGDLSGNAATATKVSHKLTINNQVFDGSQDISVNITSGTSSGTTTYNTGILAGYNTAIGDGALSKNGYSSVINEITQTISTIGIGNVAIGSQSLLNNTTGSFNTAVGCMAVNDASFNGNKNTTIGAFSDISGNIENSTAIGANAIVTTSNTIQLGDGNIDYVKTSGDIYTTGNINATTFNGSHFQGIGTDPSIITSVGIFNSYITTPQISVSGDASFNKIYGGKNGDFNVDASGNVTAPNLVTLINPQTINGIKTFMSPPVMSGASITTSTIPTSAINNYGNGYQTIAGMNTALGSYVTTSAQNTTLNSYVTTSAQTVALGSYVTTTAQTTALTLYQTIAGMNTAYVKTSGNSTITGILTATSFNAISDYRVKENVQQLDPTLFNVDKLNPVTYNKIDSGKQDIGFIAHEVQEVFPCLVTGEKDGEQTQSLNYLGLIGVLVKEIQELKKRVAILENR